MTAVKTEEPEVDGKTNGVVCAARGKWGENLAAAFLASRGWSVIGRNVRPCERDKRCEIDLIVRSADRRSVVFVEVKTHKKRSDRATRLWSVDRRKRNILLRACTNWILKNRWHGNFRFDVVEVYGMDDSSLPPEIDHIENVALFPPKWRFW